MLLCASHKRYLMLLSSVKLCVWCRTGGGGPEGAGAYKFSKFHQNFKILFNFQKYVFQVSVRFPVHSSAILRLGLMVSDRVRMSEVNFRKSNPDFQINSDSWLHLNFKMDRPNSAYLDSHALNELTHRPPPCPFYREHRFPV